MRKYIRVLYIVVLCILLLVSSIGTVKIYIRNKNAEMFTFEEYYDRNYKAWEATGESLSEFEDMYENMVYAWETYEVPSMKRELYYLLGFDFIILISLLMTVKTANQRK